MSIQMKHHAGRISIWLLIAALCLLIFLAISKPFDNTGPSTHHIYIASDVPLKLELRVLWASL